MNSMLFTYCSDALVTSGVIFGISGLLLGIIIGLVLADKKHECAYEARVFRRNRPKSSWMVD